MIPTKDLLMMSYHLAKNGVIPLKDIDSIDFGLVIKIWEQFNEDAKKDMEFDIMKGDRIATMTANNLYKLLRPVFKALLNPR